MATADQMGALAVRLNNTYVNFDGAYGNQCWDSVAYICALLGQPVVNTVADGTDWSGYAGTMYRGFPQSDEVAANYVRIGPDQPAEPGDIIVWGAVPGLYPLTHTATAVADKGLQLLCLSQNSSSPRPDLPGYSSYTSGPIILQTLPKTGLLGYLRYTGGISAASSITPQGDIVADAKNTQLELQTAVQTVLMSNKIVKGPRSVAEALTQLLDSTDIIGARGLQALEEAADIKELLGAILKQVSAKESTSYVKGKDKPEVYALEGGNLRHVDRAEFDLVNQIGLWREVPQGFIDALIKARS